LAGETRGELAATWICPTFAELAGVTPRRSWTGRSLVPLLLVRPRAGPLRTAFLVEHWRRSHAAQIEARRGAPVEPPDEDQALDETMNPPGHADSVA